MQVIGTVGLPGSGKGEAAAVAREEGVPVVTMGDVVRDACRDRDLDPSEHHGDVAKALREEEGPAAIADRSLPMVRSAIDESGAVLVDGLRSPVEVETFERAFGADFLVVSVEAPFETRARRLGARGRDASDADLQALRDREERELGFGMGEVMDDADVVIRNVESLDAYRDRIRRLLREGPGALTGESAVEVRIEGGPDSNGDAGHGRAPNPDSASAPDPDPDPAPDAAGPGSRDGDGATGDDGNPEVTDR
jgi:dephospho-CoA kinase